MSNILDRDTKALTGAPQTLTGYAFEARDMNKKRIYVADDDANILELMKIILESKGFEVITSSDGRSLIKLNELPDLVFLDIAMSGSDGSEICRDFKNQHEGDGSPVVLVSANINIHEIGAGCGADAVLPKPFDIRAVVDLARRFTGTGNN